MLKFRKLSEFQNQLSDIWGKVLIIQYVKGLQRDTKKYIDEIYRLALIKQKEKFFLVLLQLKLMKIWKRIMNAIKMGNYLVYVKVKLIIYLGKNKVNH